MNLFGANREEKSKYNKKMKKKNNSNNELFRQGKL